VDYATMDSIYEQLCEVESVRSALSASITRVCASAAAIPIPNASEPASLRLRGIAILLEYGGWKKSEDSEALKNLTKALSRLTVLHRGALAEFLSYYPYERLEALIGVLQQFLTLRWLMGTDGIASGRARLGVEITWTVMALGVAYDANERHTKRSPNSQVVHYEAFHNDAINNDDVLSSLSLS
jgi:hypothetical protein